MTQLFAILLLLPPPTPGTETRALLCARNSSLLLFPRHTLLPWPATMGLVSSLSSFPLLGCFRRLGSQRNSSSAWLPCNPAWLWLSRDLGLTSLSLFLGVAYPIFTKTPHSLKALHHNRCRVSGWREGCSVSLSGAKATPRGFAELWVL